MPRRTLTPSTVIAAAADLADEAGFDRMTLSEVARRLGVQTASLYSHVRDRAALLAAVQELAMTELADRIADCVAGLAGADALRALADAHREYAREHPGRWAAMQQPAPVTDTPSPAAQRVVRLNIAVLRGYRIPDSELVHVIRTLAAVLHGFLGLELSGGFGELGPDTGESWHRLVTALDAMLRTWPDSPETDS